MSFCPECGGVDLVRGCGVDGEVLSLVCDTCGTEVDPDLDKENESIDEEDEEDEDDGEEDSVEDSQGARGVKRSGEDVRQYTPLSPKKLKSKEVLAASRDKVKAVVETVIELCPETSKCKSCEGTNFVTDFINDIEHVICRDCGTFSEVQVLIATKDYTTAGNSGQAYGWSRAPIPRLANVGSQVNKGNVYGVETIQHMSSELNWQGYLTDEAVTMYKEIYPHKLVKNTSNGFKEALCVACLYSVARENNIKLTLKTLIALKNARTKFVTRALRILKSIRKKPLAHQTVSSLPEHVLSGCNFSRVLLDKVTKLVRVCEKGFVTQGRDHGHVVTSVAHLVWICEEYHNRKSVSLPRFCSQHKLKFTRHCSIVQKHIKQLLVTLARQLPWVSSDAKSVNQRNFLHFLDGVATYGLSLVSRANQSDATAEDESSVDSSRSSSGDGEAGPKLPLLAPPSMRFAKSAARDSSSLILPAHLTAADLDREDLSDAEFSDLEISSYILSSREAEVKGMLTTND